MNINSIKLKIAVSLALILLLGMGLIDFIVVVTGQSHFVDTEIQKGQLLAALVGEHLILSSDGSRVSMTPEFRENIPELLQDYGILRFLVLDRHLNPVYGGNQQSEVDRALFRIVRQAMDTKRTKSRYHGSTWGIFWKQHQNILLSAPLFREKKLHAGIGVVIALDGFFNSMRQSQKIVILYILFNAILLTLLGLYRVSKLTLSPIKRLVDRAGEYRDDGLLVFKAGKEESEFGQLSTALNRMMDRIARDRDALKQSLISLEHANIEIKKAQNEMVRAEKLASVGRLAAGIAHEIGNPIGIVLGYLGLLREDQISRAEREDYIKRAEGEISRIQLIIRELLDFSRPSEEVSGHVSIHGIITEITEILKVQPIMNEIEIQLQLDANHDIVYADPNQLRQVFVNLLMNAADAISTSKKNEKGRLQVVTDVVPVSEKGDSQPLLMIQIIDNGTGIPAENIDAIFDPFFTTKEPGKGTGLGLSVCFMLIEQAGGRIKAESKENQGTIISIHLPVVSPENG